MTKQEQLLESLKARIENNLLCVEMLQTIIDKLGRKEACKRLQLKESNLSKIINPNSAYPRMYPQFKISILINVYNELK